MGNSKSDIAHAGLLCAKDFVDASGRGISAAAGLEFALIVPFLLLGLIGAVDLGTGAYRNMQVHDAAQAGAQYAVANGFNAADIQTAVLSATSYSEISASPAPQQFCGCATTTGVTTISCGSSCASGAAAGTYVSVAASATYRPALIFSNIFPNSFALSARSTVRIK